MTERNTQTTVSSLVNKLWRFCDQLRDHGLSYGDYVQQLTNLLFLKMAHERTLPPYDEPPVVPVELSWPTLMAKNGEPLERHYRHILEELGSKPGTLGVIFRKSQNKIESPSLLKKVIADLIDKEQWLDLAADVKGEAYEGLLEKNAQDTKSGAGQYFTPRALIDGMVDVMKPKPGQTICDPACGTAGFLLAAYSFISRHYASTMTIKQKQFLQKDALRGWEIVAPTARLAAMNFLLHGLGEPEDECPIIVSDALATPAGAHFDMVLANPPFGRSSTTTIIGADGEEEKERTDYNRNDFWATTSNKQLNFLQHIFSLLKQDGRAAVVVPDNVLFEGGAGETIRKKLLSQCDVHTLLRLPTGIFYANGVKANVIFFDRKPAQAKPWTECLWVYDLRTNKNFTLKTKTLKRPDLDEFVDLFCADNRRDREATWSEENPTGRWRSYMYDELIARDKTSLDLTWLRDESLEDAADLPERETLATEIMEDLQAALVQLSEVYASSTGETQFYQGKI